jgi:hypothetical protein
MMAAAGPPRGLLRARSQILAGRTGGRQQSDDHSGERGDEKSEREHDAVQPDRCSARQSGRRERHQRAERHGRNHHRQRAAQYR